jgi:hypothetical protein
MHHERATEEVAGRLQRAVETEAADRVRAGVDLIEPRLAVARLLAASGVPFAAARATLRRLALDSMFGHSRDVFRK